MSEDHGSKVRGTGLSVVLQIAATARNLERGAKIWEQQDKREKLIKELQGFVRFPKKDGGPT